MDVSDDWSCLTPAEVHRLAADGPSRTAVLGLSSLHRDGRVREEAVRLLGGVRDGEELLFLLLRGHDWDKPVAAAAAELPPTTAAWFRERLAGVLPAT